MCKYVYMCIYIYIYNLHRSGSLPLATRAATSALHFLTARYFFFTFWPWVSYYKLTLTQPFALHNHRSGSLPLATRAATFALYFLAARYFFFYFFIFRPYISHYTLTVNFHCPLHIHRSGSLPLDTSGNLCSTF